MKTLAVPIFISFFLLLFVVDVSGQYKKPDRLFLQGDLDVLVGFGLLPTFLKDDINQELPSLSLRFDYRVGRNYNLGLEGAFSETTTKKDYPLSDKRQYRNRFHQIALRNSVHCNCENLDNWDIFGGFSLGLILTRISVVDGTFGPLEALYGIKPQKYQLLFTGFLGARYACSHQLSFFGELGYGASIIQLGIGYKL